MEKEKLVVGVIMNKTRRDELRIAKILRGMRYRCKNPKYHDYHRYGGRGITVCEEWDKNTDSFIKWSLNNGYDSNKSIDRIDVNKGYSPDNCRWVDMNTQQNNRGNNIILSYKGEQHTIRDWADILGVEYEVIKDRYHKGWDVVDILEKPKNSHRTLLTLHGETKYIADWAKELDVEVNTLRHRVKRGYSDDDIINGKRSNVKSPKPKITLEYNGKEQSLSKWSKELGANKGTLYNRYYKGWTNKEILYGKGLSNEDKRIYLKYDNKRLPLKEWVKIVGVHRDTLRNRMKKGYSIEEILYGKGDK